MASLLQVPTPALVVELEMLEGNIERMAAHLSDSGRAFRPHAKTHKCPDLAKLQVAAGALGVACARLWEAEAMAAEGIRGVLLTSEIVAPEALRRLISLLQAAPDTMVVVDSRDGAARISAAARAGGVTVNAVVDVDVGGRRTGVRPGPAAVELALEVSAMPAIRFCGLQGYAGQVSHIAGWPSRRQASLGAMEQLTSTRELAEASGLEVSIVAGGSTGTYDIDSEVRGVTELQAGSYCLMDLEYRSIGSKDSDVFDDFGMALTVMATVISVSSDRAIVDAGVKAFATDTAFTPCSLGHDDLAYEWAGDEHGRLVPRHGGRLPALGERIRFHPPHCDPTINLYDRLHIVREGDVVAVWPITGRGPT
jgi:D-serine deaminase-like pyridoxal phosphate-dependent protein